VFIRASRPSEPARGSARGRPALGHLLRRRREGEVKLSVALRARSHRANRAGAGSRSHSTPLHPRVSSGVVHPLGFGDAGREGTPPRCQKSSPPGRRDASRFHDASTAPFGIRLSAAAGADIPLPKRPPDDAPGRTRTCDPLLRRREHLLRSTAACRSACATSDGPHIAAAFCCGLPLPPRFHVDPPLSRKAIAKSASWRHTCFSSKAGVNGANGRAIEITRKRKRGNWIATWLLRMESGAPDGLGVSSEE
jgi:hypothetical protein